MNNDLNTLLTTLYVFLTDRVLPDLGYTRAGRPVRKVCLDDAELLWLVVYARIASRLLALAAGIWHTNTPRKRSLTAYEH